MRIVSGKKNYVSGVFVSNDLLICLNVSVLFLFVCLFVYGNNLCFGSFNYFGVF